MRVEGGHIMGEMRGIIEWIIQWVRDEGGHLTRHCGGPGRPNPPQVAQRAPVHCLLAVSHRQSLLVPAVSVGMDVVVVL